MKNKDKYKDLIESASKKNYPLHKNCHITHAMRLCPLNDPTKIGKECIGGQCHNVTREDVEKWLEQDNDLDYKELNRKIVFHYGEDRQTNLAMEELAELIQAINKVKRYPDKKERRNRLIEEIGDVKIMLDQLQLIYNITDDEIDKSINYKLRRSMERINSNVIKLSAYEVFILRELRHDCNYIARDSNGYLYAYEKKPIKSITRWGLGGDFKLFDTDTTLFTFIRWEDKEPYCIGNLLNNCEVINND